MNREGRRTDRHDDLPAMQSVAELHVLGSHSGPMVDHEVSRAVISVSHPARVTDDAHLTVERIQVLGGYAKEKPMGKGWTIQCPHPGHPDVDPSASLIVGRDGQAVLHCFACVDSNAPAWIRAVTNRLEDGVLFAPARPRRSTGNGSGGGTGSPVAWYAYRDGSGRKYRKVRYEPKSFGWERRYGDNWAGGLGHTPLADLLPYGSEDLAGTDGIAYWVEGERDVDEARKRGVAALTSGGGANGPLPHDLSCVSGRSVVVVADRDPAGVSYARYVAAEVHGIAADVRLAHPRPAHKGADLTDHFDAGYAIEDLDFGPLPPPPVGARDEAADDSVDGAADEPADGVAGGRSVRLTRASSIAIKPVRWAWQDRMPMGALTLVAGREGLGKSTVVAWIIAAITQGTLPGDIHGCPRAVFVSATEDSWECTIVPRLMAAGADLDLVYRVDVTTSIDTNGDLTLPKDVPALRRLASDLDAAMLVLDPLMSRLDASIDSHKDADTRRALEPLTALAGSTGMVVLGLMHFNKGAGSDPLNAIMASKAFTAVARSVHTIVCDGDDEAVRYFATAKNNLGRDDLPLKGFSIAAHALEVPDATIRTSKVIWGAESRESVRDLMARSFDDGHRTATKDAVDWLSDYMASQGGIAESAAAKAAGQQAGHSKSTINRARERLNLQSQARGFPRRTVWVTAEQAAREVEPPVDSLALGRESTETTGTTKPTGAQSYQSFQSHQAGVWLSRQGVGAHALGAMDALDDDLRDPSGPALGGDR